ncbi:MAG: ABC transporter ATP-binding protein [Clostridia bacterium]|nr:ABC transporter ATP-binding protein [Clostridia bacterium]
MKNKAEKGTVSKVLHYIGKYKYLLPVSIFLAFISTVLTLYVPVIIGDAIDLIGGKGAVDMKGVVSCLFYAAILIGICSVCQWLMSVINNKIAYSVTGDIRNEAFSKLQRLPLSSIDTTPHGDIVNRVINDTDRFCEGLLLGFTQVFTGVMTIVGTMCFMLILNWQIAITVLVLTPLSVFIAKFIGGRTFNMFKKRAEDEAEATSFINEMLTNQKLVSAFGKESDSIAKFKDIGDRLNKSSLDAIFFSSLTNPTTRFVNNLVYAAVALVGALLIISGNGSAMLTIGEFSVMLSYTNQYTKPFNEISGVFAEFQNALASAARVFELIEKEEMTPDREDATVLVSARGDVEITNAEFSYTKDKPLIKGLNLQVRQGERIAIVGPTGCGKTTIINLLMRFYDIDSGKIAVDGIDISNMTRKSLRCAYGMVLQDTWLTDGSIRDNISFGKPDATDEEIVDAAKAAHAHSFIKRLPRGYDTVPGADSEGLSQGQKQLISIARVMLTSPSMLILDEATSSIDTRTEMKIQEAFSKMMVGRTSFIVAHRLSTIREADLILVMRDGRIVETGRHDELLENGGFYAELYNSQFAI